MGSPTSSILKSGDPKQVSKMLDDVARKANVSGKELSKTFTYNNFRMNYQKFTNKYFSAAEATPHHVILNANRIHAAKAGIDVNNPLNGVWLDPKFHRAKKAFHKPYNDEWNEFFLEDRTAKEIIEKAREMAKKYKFKTHW